MTERRIIISIQPGLVKITISINSLKALSQDVKGMLRQLEYAFTIGHTDDISSGDGFITFNSTTIGVNITKMNNTQWWNPLPSGKLGGSFTFASRQPSI